MSVEGRGLKGRRLKVEGWGSRVGRRGSRVDIRGSRVKGQGSRVKGQGSRVKGLGLNVEGRASRAKGREGLNPRNIGVKKEEGWNHPGNRAGWKQGRRGEKNTKRWGQRYRDRGQEDKR
eukprot:1487916-Rhodomonas_salina.1